MLTTDIPGSSYTEFSDLAKLKAASIADPEKALESVARQFESLFTQMILKSMRSAELSSGLFDNNQTKMYQDILDKQLSTSLSSQKGLGIADMLIGQLTRSQKNKSPISNSIHNTVNTKNNMNHLQSNDMFAQSTEFSNPSKFVNNLYSIAKDIESKYQIPANYLLAQSALETGWGKHVIHDRFGASSFNLFGIKAGDDWHGKVVSARTTEYVSGQPVTKYEKFRAYATFKESMTDYAGLISSDPRYVAAYKQKSDPLKYFNGLQLAGYASDPNYSNKINKILNIINAKTPGLA